MTWLLCMGARSSIGWIFAKSHQALCDIAVHLLWTSTPMSPMLVPPDKLSSFLEECYHAPVQFGHRGPCCTHQWFQHIQTHHLRVLQSLGSVPMRSPVSCSPSLQLPSVLRPSLLFSKWMVVPSRCITSTLSIW